MKCFECDGSGYKGIFGKSRGLGVLGKRCKSCNSGAITSSPRQPLIYIPQQARDSIGSQVLNALGLPELHPSSNGGRGDPRRRPATYDDAIGTYRNSETGYAAPVRNTQQLVRASSVPPERRQAALHIAARNFHDNSSGLGMRPPDNLVPVWHSVKTTGCNCEKKECPRSYWCNFFHKNSDTGSYERCKHPADRRAHVHDAGKSAFFYVDSCRVCNAQHGMKMWVSPEKCFEIHCRCGRLHMSQQSVRQDSAVVEWQRPGRRYHERIPTPNFCSRPTPVVDPPWPRPQPAAGRARQGYLHTAPPAPIAINPEYIQQTHRHPQSGGYQYNLPVMGGALRVRPVPDPADRTSHARDVGHCSCCGAVGKTIMGCSCRGGHSHTCLLGL